MRTIKQLEKEIEEFTKLIKSNRGDGIKLLKWKYFRHAKDSQLKQTKEIVELIDKNYADMVSLIEHEFTDDRVAEKITNYIEDYKKELKVLITGGQSK